MQLNVLLSLDSYPYVEDSYDLIRDVPPWPQVLITMVSLLSIRVVDLCLFFFSNLLPGILDESLFSW